MTVLALLKFEGTDGSTTFTDTTGNQTWAIAVGAPEIDTAQYKFGSSSMLIDAVDGIDTTLATSMAGDFYVEVWYRQNSAIASGNCILFRLDDSSSTNYVYVQSDYAGTVKAYSSAGATLASPAGYLKEDEWTHVALQRDSNGYLGLWINGTCVAGHVGSSTNTTAFDTVTVGVNLTINSADGWLDSFRIIDEARVTTGGWDEIDQDPGTTYTAQTAWTAFKIKDYTPFATEQFTTPFSWKNANHAVIRERVCEDTGGGGGGTGGIQYWG